MTCWIARLNYWGGPIVILSRPLRRLEIDVQLVFGSLAKQHENTTINLSNLWHLIVVYDKHAILNFIDLKRSTCFSVCEVMTVKQHQGHFEDFLSLTVSLLLNCQWTVENLPQSRQRLVTCNFSLQSSALAGSLSVVGIECRLAISSQTCTIQ